MIGTNFDNNYFIYNDVDSEYFNNLKFLRIDTEPTKKMGGAATYKKIKSYGQHSDEIQGIRYETPISFDFEMVADSVLSDVQVREIYQSYFDLADYANLFIRDEEWADLHFECTMNEIEKIEKGLNNQFGVVGFKGVVTCNSPFVYEGNDEDNLFTTTYKVSDGTLVINTATLFNNDSDCKDYAYPTITVKAGATGGILTIENTTDNARKTIFGTATSGVTANEIIIADQKTGLVSPAANYPKFNKVYFRLLPGINSLKVTGDVIEFSFSYKKARVMI